VCECWATIILQQAELRIGVNLIARPIQITGAIVTAQVTVPFALPFTAKFSMPGPEIVMFLATNSSLLVNAIVPVTAKLIVSPSLASASA